MVHESIKEEAVSVVAHGVGSGEKTNVAVCKQTPHFAIELESVCVATEVPIQEELVNVNSEELAADVITSSIREPEAPLWLKTMHLRQRQSRLSSAN